VLLRDAYRCRIAYPGTWRTRDGELRRCLELADCVHHLDGKRYGDNPDRLVAACTPCNLRAGEPDPPGRDQRDPAGVSVTQW
jgi:hypothetical protein